MKEFCLGIFTGAKKNSNNMLVCKFCQPVKRCMIFDKSEADMRYKYELTSYGRWNEEFIQIFQNKDYFTNSLNLKYKSCPRREIIYSYNQLINYFAVIATRVYFNLGKHFLFFSRYKQKFLYDNYLEQSKYLFSSIVKNVRKAYARSAVRYLRPVTDYDPTYFIISNALYVLYLKEKENKQSKC